MFLSAGTVLNAETNSPSFPPSLMRTNGMLMRKPMMDVMQNWFPTDPNRSLSPSVSMSFLFSLPLKAANTLAMHAEMRADHAKSSSLTEARITPPITMGRQSHLALEIFLP